MSIDYSTSRLIASQENAKIKVKGRAELKNPVKMDGIALTGEDVVRDVNVYSTNIQTPGYLYFTRSGVGKIESVRFVLGVSISNKPFIHSEGGSSATPVALSACTFTSVAGVLGSLAYSVVVVDGGAMAVVGCTFIDMAIDPRGNKNNAVVMSVSDAAVLIRNSAFTNIQLDSSASSLGRAETECVWGTYSLLVFSRSTTQVKDTLLSSTLAGMAIHGGSAVVEGTNFARVGVESTKYPSVERHVRCGM
jgi:hypothetical protein